MLNKLLSTLSVAVLLTGPAGAQEPRPPQQPTPPAEAAKAPRPPEPAGQPVNVKLELTITDQTGAGEPTKKVINMIVADRQNGFIRSRGYQKMSEGLREVIMNVDARPVINREGTIRVDLGLEYSPTAAMPTPTTTEGRSNLNQRIAFMIEPGKPLIVSQAVDPLSNSRITVELKATIMK
jgi:hypothetical protein